MTSQILCVCLGNICRSPTAEAALRAALGPDVTVDSAGTSDWHIGDPPYGPMQDAARAHGIDMSTLRARQVTVQDFDRFDLILAMDKNNLAKLRAMQPAGSKARLALFLDPVHGAGTEVPDPYYTRDFDGVVALIQAAAAAWRDQLQNSSAASVKAT